MGHSLPDESNRQPASQSTEPVQISRSPGDIALAARLLAVARTTSPFRARKVRRLRAAIKVRAYENELKLAVAIDRLFSSVAPE